MSYKNLFEPIKIGNCEIPNRYFMSPMFPFGMAEENGAMSRRYEDYYVERAKGGTGLIITGLCKVENNVECMTPIHVHVNEDPMIFIQSATRMVKRVHYYGAKIFLQMSAGWGRALWTFAGKKYVAPDAGTVNKYDDNVICGEITTEDVEGMVKAFARTAAIAKVCGFDGVEIHAVHEGYLMDQFATEFFNHRTDKYGGSFENRYRFAAETVQAIKHACGKDFPVSLRYSPKHFMRDVCKGGVAGEKFEEKGRDMEEGLKAAKYLADAGYDALNVDVGCYDAHYWSHPTVYFEDGLYLPFAEEVKKVVDVPILCAGRMDNPEFASKAVADGKIDMVGLGRPLLADPYLPLKVRKGEIDCIRWCINCNVGCGNYLTTGNLSCAVNPTSCYEKERALNPLFGKSKDVVVVGGGPGGIQAALTASKRGHNVTLYEKSDRLGGNLITASGADFKFKDEMLIKCFEKELSSTNVKIKRNTTVTPEMIEKSACDTVIVATGSTSVKPKIAGAEKNDFYSASEVLTDINKAGEKVVVIGGGQVGVETAIWLAQKGKTVTIVEALPKIMSAKAPVVGHVVQHSLELIRYLNIGMLTNSTVCEVTENAVIINNSGEHKSIEADTIIYSVGYRSDNSLYQTMYKKPIEVYNIGDSNEVSNVYNAIHSAYEIANNI